MARITGVNLKYGLVDKILGVEVEHAFLSMSKSKNHARLVDHFLQSVPLLTGFC